MTPDEILKLLQPVGRAIGLDLYKAAFTGFSYKVFARILAPTHGAIEIDAETIECIEPKNPKAFMQLVIRTLEDAQIRIIDGIRDELAKVDVLGRIAHMTRDDRRLLHEMYDEATKSLYARFEVNEERVKATEAKHKAFGELVGKLVGR